MNEAPEELTWGPQKLRAKFNKLRRFALTARPLRTEDCEITETPDGSLIEPVLPDVTAGGAVAMPFELYADFADAEAPVVRVRASTLAGRVPELPMPDADGSHAFAAVAGTRYIYGLLTLDDEVGEITAAELIDDETFALADNDGQRYVLIGRYIYDAEAGTLEVLNYRYGAVDADVYRDWFAAEAPFHKVAWGAVGA